MTFRIRGLEAGQFSHLFALSDAALAEQGAVRKIADAPSPCRISLTDATPGDEVLLVNYEHHAVESPYRMRFAIYVREGEQTFDAVDVVPDQLRRRTLAVRGFDDKAMMTGWELSRASGWRKRSNAGSPNRAQNIFTFISPRPAAMRPGSSGLERRACSHSVPASGIFPARSCSPVRR